MADEAWTEHYYGQQPGRPPHPTCVETATLAGVRSYVCGPDCPKPAGPDPARDARVDAYRDRERRRAARALDRYMELIYDEDIAAKRGAEIRTAGERFVEQVGDYVLARLGERPAADGGGPTALFGADAHGGGPDGIGSLPFEGCDWPAEQCSGHYSIRSLPNTERK